MTRQRPADSLYALAEGQAGYFTASQARLSGYRDNTHLYHVQTGEWVREWRAIYRLARFPIQPEGQWVLWALWSRNAAGQVQGILSHQTALTLFDLTDLMPAKLHMTVPRNFRRRAETPKILVLHRGEIPEADREQRHGYALTKPLRTLLDLLEEGSVHRVTLVLAGREAVQRGLILESELKRPTALKERKAFLLDLERR